LASPHQFALCQGGAGARNAKKANRFQVVGDSISSNWKVGRVFGPIAADGREPEPAFVEETVATIER
jgi:hypothetical protein